MNKTKFDNPEKFIQSIYGKNKTMMKIGFF